MANRPAAVARLTREEARQQAQAEGLTLRVADTNSGYFGVHLSFPGRPKPYQVQVWRGGTRVHLGSFATAEEAALCVARSPEGQAAAAEQASAVPQPRRSEEEGQGNAPATRSRAVLKQEGTVPPMPPGAFVKEEDVPAAAAVKEEGAVPPMPPDAFVVKTEAIVKEEVSSGSRPKRQRRK